MKKKILVVFIILLVLLLVALGYKLFLLNKYKIEELSINPNTIFSETLVISNQVDVTDEEIFKFEKLSFKNYFTEYEKHKTNPSIKVKYDNEGKISSSYTISKETQYINMYDSLKDIDIENDIDLLKYVKDNYLVRNNLFTSKNKMEKNYVMHSFVDNCLPEFKNIVLIEGRLTGYIINMYGSDIKEVRLLHNNEQYIISLNGEEITNNEFITNLLETVKFD